MSNRKTYRSWVARRRAVETGDRFVAEVMSRIHAQPSGQLKRPSAWWWGVAACAAGLILAVGRAVGIGTILMGFSSGAF